MEQNPKWQIIDALGAELGVGDEARRKWKTRGVAHRWRLPILEIGKQKRAGLKPSDMEAANV